jgi:hypothetical protein
MIRVIDEERNVLWKRYKSHIQENHFFNSLEPILLYRTKSLQQRSTYLNSSVETKPAGRDGKGGRTGGNRVFCRTERIYFGLLIIT